MKRDNVNYLLVGSFVLLMAAVLLYALYRITGHRAKGDIYFTHFPNVTGIKQGTVVTYEGFEVGNVAEVDPVLRNQHTAYRVTLNMRRPVRIPVDSRAVIATPGMLSAPLVEIKEGNDQHILAAGGDIPGSSNPSMMESIGTLAADLGRLTETSIKPLLAQLNQNMTPAMADMRSTLERINRSAGSINALFSEDNVRHWNRMLANGDGASVNVLKLSTDLLGVRTEVEGLVKDSRGIVNSSGNNLKDSLRRIDAALYQLEATGRNLNEFSRHLRHNPGALIQSRPPTDAASGAAQ
ncbi:MAG TPA: MlaD family protein [Rhodoferax sp.]|nr:MlaD family protein [Rhodoferax sp.]